MNLRLVTLAALGLALLGAGCKEGPTVGEFAVNLTTPNSDDGAIQFQATASAPNTITAVSSPCGNCKLFLVKVSDTQYKGVVTGPISAGTLFRIGVSDTKTPSTYSVQIVSVSTRTYQTRGGSGYSVALQ